MSDESLFKKGQLLVQQENRIHSLEAQVKELKKELWEKDVLLSNYEGIEAKAEQAEKKLADLERSILDMSHPNIKSVMKELESYEAISGKMADGWCLVSAEDFEKLKTLEAQNARLLLALKECREYFDQRSDCDHNGITFVANEENRLLGVVDSAIQQLSNQGDGK
jgi:hypothetical protein